MNQNTIFFFRDFQNFGGGHLKVWNYFNHFINRGDNPYILFSENSTWDESNPWRHSKNRILTTATAIEPDLLFLAGLDWQMANPLESFTKSKPIINLIQGIRHIDPDLPLYSFLQNKAIRICVSEQVAAAIKGTKQANGPIYTIPNCLDPQEIPQAISDENRPVDILIAGLKHPGLAQQLFDKLKPLNKQVVVLTDHKSRADYLDLVNQAKITVFLPFQEEGFYLPALEAMSMESLVICPDCIGNRSFCLPNNNCFRPEYNFLDILGSIHTALSLSYQDRKRLISNAKMTALKNSLETEQKAFYEILNNLHHIW